MYLRVSDLGQAGDLSPLATSQLYANLSAAGRARRRNVCVVFPKRGGAIYTNKVAMAEGRFFLDPNLMGWEIASDRFDARYVALVLKTRTLEDLADVSSVPQLNNKHVNPTFFPAPPKLSQGEIVEWIDREAVALNEALRLVNRETSLIREYRTRLIADVVTGKLDVREAAACLPDEPGEADSLEDEERLEEAAEPDEDAEAEDADA